MVRDLKNKIQAYLSVIPNDKLLHYFYGSILAFIFSIFFKPLIVILLVFIIAVVKEIIDGKFSVIDVLYTILPSLFFAFIAFSSA